jgi:hypothetical protein
MEGLLDIIRSQPAEGVAMKLDIAGAKRRSGQVRGKRNTSWHP